MAVFSILSAIIFTGFRDENTRSAAKRAAEALQIDIQEMQNSAQSGIQQGGEIPPGYGIQLIKGEGLGFYYLFADSKVNPTTLGDNHYNDTSLDVDIRTVTMDREVYVVGFKPSVVDFEFLDIVYQRGGSKVVMTGKKGTTYTNIQDPVTIVLRQPKYDICFGVTVESVAGTVNRREMTSCTL